MYPPNVLFLTAAVLFAFGAGYNALVDYLERRGWDEGYTAFLVAGGVGVTLLVLAIIDWKAAALSLAAFVCSGLPMIIGSWWRHVRRREHGHDAQRREIPK